MKSNRLSHSQVQRYQLCGQSWKYHYIDRIRPTTSSAALFLGTAIDKAFSAMLEEKSQKTPEQIFDYFFRFQEINGKQEYLPKSLNVVYSNNDVDTEIILEEDVVKIKEELKIEDVHTEMDKLLSEKEVLGYTGLPDDRKMMFNFIAWHCLKAKGLLMLEALERDVVPQITKVYSTQEYVKLQNNDGDEIIGYVDLVADIKGYDRPIILDLKSSSRLYEKDSVMLSPQLSLYVHELSDKYQTRHAGYIVLLKNIVKNRTKKCSACGKDGTGQKHKTCDAVIDGKRCNAAWNEKIKPEVKTQLLIDEIPEPTEMLVLENYDFINQSIKNGVVHKNLQSCKNTYGGDCQYINLCYRGSMKGLVQLESKNEV